MLLISESVALAAAQASVRQAVIVPQTIKVPVVYGSDIHFSRLYTTEGLSQGRVAQIIQDDLGFMWFGTQYGLNRYDGYKFKIFKHEPGNPSSLSGVYVYALFKDRAGSLWVGCDQYLDKFDPVKETFTHYRVGSQSNDGSGATVVHISQDRAGILWLASRVGLYKLDPTNGKITSYHHNLADPYSLASNDIKSTGEDKLGTFWVVTNEGLDAFERTSGRVTLHVPLHDSSESSFYEDSFGVFWIIHSSDTGLAVFDRKKNELTRYSFYDREPPRGALSGVGSILEDCKGNLWLATQGAGLLKFDRDHDRFICYRNRPNDRDSLAGNRLISLYEDREGDIWLGQSGSGINLFTPTHQPFKILPHETGNLKTAGDTLVNTIQQDRNGATWMGTAGGLNCLRPAGDSYAIVRRLLPGVNVISIAEDKSGLLWVGTFGEGLKRVDTGTGHVETYRHNQIDPHSLSNDIVPGLLIDRTGTLWAATWDGLNRFEPATSKFSVYKRDPKAFPQLYLSVVEDPKGFLWLGTHFSGLQRFDPATGRFAVFESDPKDPNSVSDSRVNSVHFDHSGVMWVGTQNGLDRFDPQTGKFADYYERDGLAGDTVSCLLEDAHQNLWISTNKGLSCLDSSRKLFRNYTLADGLPGNDLTGWTACSKNRSGEMFFGGFSGATAFNPAEVGESQEIPPIVLTDFTLSGNHVPVRPNSPFSKSISYESRLVLSSKQNIFSLEFSALSYANPPSNRYRYMLEGLEDKWYQVGADRRLASYTTLPSGTYTLRVQGATSRGPWSSPGLALKIEVLPPWWKTWWFTTMYVIVGLCLVWLAYAYRFSKLSREFTVRLEERVRERTRIARELHDTLLQSFHGLMLRFQAVQNMLPEGPAKESLEIAIDRAAGAITEGRDAVQALRRSRDSSDDLVQTLTSLGQELGADHAATGQDATPITFRVLVEGKPRQVRAALHDDLCRIASEAIRNAFRHAKANRIEVDLRYGQRMLRLRIRDDGAGMDPKLLTPVGRAGHWGLPGMRERAKKIGGRLDVWSQLNRGTEVEVTIPGAIAYSESGGRDESANLRRQDE